MPLSKSLDTKNWRSQHDSIIRPHHLSRSARREDFTSDEFSYTEVRSSESLNLLQESTLLILAIVPGQLNESHLIQRVLSNDMDVIMPSAETDKPLSQQQKELLKRWIEQGAEYEAHWSYVAPVRPAFPIVNSTDWPRNEIDHFVLARLEHEGLQPSSAAELTTLVRRLSLDLTGRMLTESSPDLESQVSRGFRLLLSRSPMPAELAVLSASYQRSLASSTRIFRNPSDRDSD